MVEDQVYLLSAYIYKDRKNFTITLSESKEFKAANYYYQFISDRDSYQNYNNTLIIKDEKVYLLHPEQLIDLPTYIKKYISIAKEEDGEKCIVSLKVLLTKN